MRYEAVTFDFWNTLVAETRAPVELRIRLWRERLEASGIGVTDDDLEAAFKHAWGRFEARWRANEPAAAGMLAADAIAHLDVPPDPELAADLARLHLEASLLTPRELLPGVEEIFDRLRGLGLGVGIVSDVAAVPASQLRRWLDELGVLHLVNHFSFSDEVGAFKPDPRIFRHALDGLGVSAPSRAAHVGDLRRTDVAGARAVGMVSVQYTGGRADGDGVEAAEGADPDHVIGDHAELLDALGLR